MKVSVYKYTGEYGMGFIFTIPGRGIDIKGIRSKDWTFMDVYDIDRKFLDDCTEKEENKVWISSYIE